MNSSENSWTFTYWHTAFIQIASASVFAWISGTLNIVRFAFTKFSSKRLGTTANVVFVDDSCARRFRQSRASTIVETWTTMTWINKLDFATFACSIFNWTCTIEIIDQIMAYTAIFTWIRFAFVNELVAELAHVASVASTIYFSCNLFTCAIIAWIQSAFHDFFLTIRTIVTKWTLAFITGHMINAYTVILAWISFTVVNVYVTSFTSESKFAQANAFCRY